MTAWEDWEGGVLCWPGSGGAAWLRVEAVPDEDAVSSAAGRLLEARVRVASIEGELRSARVAVHEAEQAVGDALAATFPLRPGDILRSPGGDKAKVMSVEGDGAWVNVRIALANQSGRYGGRRARLHDDPQFVPELIERDGKPVTESEAAQFEADYTAWHKRNPNRYRDAARPRRRQ